MTIRFHACPNFPVQNPQLRVKGRGYADHRPLFPQDEITTGAGGGGAFVVLGNTLAAPQEEDETPEQSRYA